MRSDAQVVAVSAYIARNPVEAGLCSRPEAWPWSSYRATLSDERPVWLAAERMLEWFGDSAAVARETFAAQVAFGSATPLESARLKGSDPLREATHGV